jgi:hypothetical protein
MHRHSPADAGRPLDQRIARLVDGERKSSDPPFYSTQDFASDDLVTRLRSHGIEAELEQDGDTWYCIFWASLPGDGVRERVASGSADTRALAICRAVLNLPISGTGRRLHLRTASRGWIGDDEFPRAAGQDPIATAAHMDGEPSGATRAARES